MPTNSFDKRRTELKEFNEALEDLQIRNKKEKDQPTVEIPEGLIVSCPKCGYTFLGKSYTENLYVCPSCGYHARLHAQERLREVLDPNYKTLFSGMKEQYMDFPSYSEKLEKAKKTTSLEEAILCVDGTIDHIPCLVGVMDSYFMMGSMGSVVGEMVTLLAEKALKEKKPLILFTCSGGARMQEGVVSLFQMAKTSEAIGRLKEKELYIAVLTDPTTGGVSASFASLADITLAEPGATIGFAGRRVIEQTIKETLPNDFQTAEFLLEKGYLDAIVERKDMRKTLGYLLAIHGYQKI